MAVTDIIKQEPDTNIYMYNADMQLVVGDKITPIDPVYINSIVTDYDYDVNNMPLIYVTAAFNTALLREFVRNQDSGYVIMNLQKFNANGDMPGVKTSYIKDKFIYFISDDYVLDDDDKGREEKNTVAVKNNDPNGRDFREVTFGLMSVDLLNKNKKNVGGIVNKGTVISVLNHIAGHLKLVMEPPAYNKALTQFIIPPMNSVAKSIEYVNQRYTFYKSPYRFFMDFDVSYLISSEGKYVPKKGDKIGTVLITLKNAYSDQSKVQGMSIDAKNGNYNFIISSSDVEFYGNNSSDRSYNSIKSVDSNGKTKTTDVRLSKVSQLKNKQQTVRLPNDNEGLVENMKFNIKSGSRILCINKNNLDSSIFTINKKFTVNAGDVLDPSYNGDYILSRKRELFVKQDDDLVPNTMLILKKVIK